MNMKNETAIVTGSTSGIGKKIAELLLREGCKVMICSRNENNVDKTVSEFKETYGDSVAGMLCDVSDPGSIKAVINKTIELFGSIRIVVANAGVNLIYGPLEYFGLEEINEIANKIISTNLIGTINTISAALPHMKEKNYGRIVVLSGGGADRPIPNMTPYSASKGGAAAFARCFAEELKETDLDIKINIFRPGMIRTNLDANLKVPPGWKSKEEIKQTTDLVLDYVGTDIEQSCKKVIPYLQPTCKSNGKSFMGFSVMKLIRGFMKVNKIQKQMQKEEK
ncbi:MAG: SDR family NAD(P)-dependent oxidoreductase [Candidatus Hodarchaeota archaeon]